MSTAQAIREIVQSSSAATLSMGYALRDGRQIPFEATTDFDEKRNRAGRVTRLTARYRDGSALEFRWSPARGSRWNVVE